jgi:CBS domain-containing protein
MTIKVKDVIRENNPTCRLSETVKDALVKMTASRIGAVTLVNDAGELAGVFTDGDVRRRLQENGEGILDQQMGDAGYTPDPVSVNADALLYEAVNIFNTHQIDNIVALEDNQPIGMLDIQDLVKMGLLG